jgi:hypothetical protein
MFYLMVGLFSFALGQAVIIDVDKYENKTRVVRKVGRKNV